jgi:hypothetical protein
MSCQGRPSQVGEALSTATVGEVGFPSTTPESALWSHPGGCEISDLHALEVERHGHRWVNGLVGIRTVTGSESSDLDTLAVVHVREIAILASLATKPRLAPLSRRSVGGPTSATGPRVVPLVAQAFAERLRAHPVSRSTNGSDRRPPNPFRIEAIGAVLPDRRRPWNGDRSSSPALTAELCVVARPL